MNEQNLKLDLPKQSKLHDILIWTLVVAMVVDLYLIFIWAPVERTMGVVQKIFYFHVGTAWVAFLAFGVVFVSSILFLIKRNRNFDIVAGVSAEIGVIFTAMVLTTGPIWGRSAWNTWWTWEPRLTTTLILFFIYIAYIIIRHMDGAWEKKARLASVFGIIGFIDVPIVFMAIRWWNSKLHPIVFGDGPTQTGGGVEPPMLVTLLFTITVITLLYVVLLQKGVYIEKTRLVVEKYKKHVQEKLMSKVS